MDGLDTLLRFYEKAARDGRIGVAHLGLYATLFDCWARQGFEGPVTAYAKDLMSLAKISSSATYHRLIRELAAYGYVKYLPSFYKRKASAIYLNEKIKI
ncbi:hypothetical protein ACFJIV_29200 [Mucilaginibacter sp. UC70_90]